MVTKRLQVSKWVNGKVNIRYRLKKCILLVLLAHRTRSGFLQLTRYINFLLNYLKTFIRHVVYDCLMCYFHKMLLLYFLHKFSIIILFLLDLSLSNVFAMVNFISVCAFELILYFSCVRLYQY